MEVTELKAIAGKVLNLPDAQFATLFVTKKDDKEVVVDNWEELFISQDAARIQGLKDAHTKELTKIHDKGHQKGTAEALDAWETQIKTELEYQGNEKGVELVKAIAKKTNPGKPTEVKTSPEYLELEKQFKKSNTEWEAKLQAETDRINAEYGSKAMLQNVQAKTRKLLMDMKPVLGVNPSIADTRVSNFLKEFEAYNYQESADGSLLILNPDGKRKETANGHPYEFDAMVKEMATKHFEFEQQTQRAQPGNGGEPANKTATGTIVPKNWGEAMEAMAKETDPIKVKEIQLAFESTQAVK